MEKVKKVDRHRKIHVVWEKNPQEILSHLWK